MIKQFKGRYRYLSNFFEVEIAFDGEIYSSVEHAYQAAKTLDINKRVWIKEASTPGKAKRWGRLLNLRDDWDKVKVNIMRHLLNQKFEDSNLHIMLLKTHSKEIVEGNYWHDNFWGDCCCKKCKDRKGRNQLGKLLMEIRRNKRRK